MRQCFIVSASASVEVNKWGRQVRCRISFRKGIKMSEWLCSWGMATNFICEALCEGDATLDEAERVGDIISSKLPSFSPESFKSARGLTWEEIKQALHEKGLTVMEGELLDLIPFIFDSRRLN